MPKCLHPKKTTLYAQRRDGSKRAFKPEGRKCEACGAVLPFVPEADPKG